MNKISHPINFTDRVYGCLIVGGKVIAEVMRDHFSSLSSLLDTLRAMAPSMRGLARLSVRNMTRGWTLSRPLMLYPSPSGFASAAPAAAKRAPFPWETH